MGCDEMASWGPASFPLTLDGFSQEANLLKQRETERKLKSCSCRVANQWWQTARRLKSGKDFHWNLNLAANGYHIMGACKSTMRKSLVNQSNGRCCPQTVQTTMASRFVQRLRTKHERWTQRKLPIPERCLSHPLSLSLSLYKMKEHWRPSIIGLATFDSSESALLIAPDLLNYFQAFCLC